MRLKARLYLTVAAIGIASLLAAAPAQVSAQTAVAIDNDDIGGVVTGANGPEAGVWVIAETTELPTKFARMVVTDDQGRYVIPDLPTANYQVWVRGYGLVDSPKARAKPGQQPGEFKAGAEAWMRRISSGQTGEFMVNRIAGQFAGVPFKYFGDWTDRVAKGELPKHKPPRPQGVERNIVV